MLKTITNRSRFDNTVDWARAEYAAIQQVRLDMDPSLDASLEPGPKSALFARLLSGKAPLAFPPPLSFGQPWYEVVENSGAFDVLLGGTLPACPVQTGETHYLEHLIVNGFPWGVLHGNDAAAAVSELLGRLRNCRDREQGAAIIDAIADALHLRPEWIVRVEPWPEYLVHLGRARRQGKRGEITKTRFFRESLDGTNLTITRVMIDGQKQADGKAERIAHLLSKSDYMLSPYERKIVADLHVLQAHPADNDWVEYECDAWQIERR